MRLPASSVCPGHLRSQFLPPSPSTFYKGRSLLFFHSRQTTATPHTIHICLSIPPSSIIIMLFRNNSLAVFALVAVLAVLVSAAPHGLYPRSQGLRVRAPPVPARAPAVKSGGSPPNSRATPPKGPASPPKSPLKGPANPPKAPTSPPKFQVRPSGGKGSTSGALNSKTGNNGKPGSPTSPVRTCPRLRGLSLNVCQSGWYPVASTSGHLSGVEWS